ncbi:MAG: hypothetical protein WC369_02320 [Dehalococcoidales bacterium]|jgi:hypothetical protein
MKKNNGILFVSFFLITSYYAASLYADVILLKNGKVIEGKIIEQSDSYIKAKLKVVEVKLAKSEVESVEISDLPEGFFGKAKELSVEGYSVPGDSSYSGKMRLKVSYEKTGNKIKHTSDIIVTAKTNIPDDSQVEVFLKLRDCVIDSKAARVYAGRFYVDFGPFEKIFPPAVYAVSAEFTAGDDVKPETAYSEFRIGSDRDVKETYARMRAEAENTLVEINNRFSELNRVYLANIRYYDKNKWNAWGDEWLSGLDKVDATFKDLKESYVIYLYPVVQDKISVCIKSLKNIYQMYDVQVKSSIMADKKTGSQAAYFARCKAETDNFYRLLSSMMDDVTKDRAAGLSVAGDILNRAD